MEVEMVVGIGGKLIWGCACGTGDDDVDAIVNEAEIKY